MAVKTLTGYRSITGYGCENTYQLSIYYRLWLWNIESLPIKPVSCLLPRRFLILTVCNLLITQLGRQLGRQLGGQMFRVWTRKIFHMYCVTFQLSYVEFKYSHIRFQLIYIAIHTFQHHLYHRLKTYKSIKLAATQPVLKKVPTKESCVSNNIMSNSLKVLNAFYLLPNSNESLSSIGFMN